jgi:hypothetical protein
MYNVHDDDDDDDDDEMIMTTTTTTMLFRETRPYSDPKIAFGQF